MSHNSETILKCPLGQVTYFPARRWQHNIAVAGSMTALVGSGIGWHRAAVTEQQNALDKIAARHEKLRIREIREALGNLLIEASKLQVKAAQSDPAPLPTEEVQRWLDNTHSYIAGALGHSYTARLLDPSGIIPQAPNISKDRQYLWAVLNVAKVRLQQFLAELPALP